MHNRRLLLPCIIGIALTQGCALPSKNIGDTLDATTDGGAGTGSSESSGDAESATNTSGGSGPATTDDPGATDTEGSSTTAVATESSATDTEGSSTTAAATESTSATATSDGTTGEASLPCGDMMCDPQTQYCSIYISDVRGVDPELTCQPLPACEGAVCECLLEELPGCDCQEDIGVTLTCAGA